MAHFPILSIIFFCCVFCPGEDQRTPLLPSRSPPEVLPQGSWSEIIPRVSPYELFDGVFPRCSPDRIHQLWSKIQQTELQLTNCATSCFEIMKSWPRERSSVLMKIGEASPQLEKSFLINIYVERERAAKFWENWEAKNLSAVKNNKQKWRKDVQGMWHAPTCVFAFFYFLAL